MKKPIRNLNLNLGTFSDNYSLFGPNTFNYTYYYYSSGIPIPENIYINKNIIDKSLLISWYMDEIRTKDIKKYCLQIKINEEEFNYETTLIIF